MKRAKKTMVRHAATVYPVILHEENSGGYWALCPSFEGCYSQGKTVEETLVNIREAIELCKEDVPRAKRNTFAQTVSVHMVAV